MQKKKKKEIYEKKFKMPYLYREDLEEIENTVKENLDGYCIKFETPEYIYDSVSEMPKEGIAKKFSIGIFKEKLLFSKNIKIEFNNHLLFRNVCEIVVQEGSAELLGVAEKIRGILVKRERRLEYLFSSNWTLFFMASSPYVLFQLPLHKNPSVRYFVVGFLLFIVIAFIILGIKSIFGFSFINFSYKKDKQNFFTRNKDQLLLMLISTMVGVVVGVVLTYLGIKN